MATDSKKRLALAIIDFLSTSLKDGTLSPEDAESIEVAQTCIADAFKVDPSNKAAVQDAIGGQNLLSIYGVYEKLKGKTTASSNSSSVPPASTPGTSVPKETPTGGASGPSIADRAKAESLKGQGNAAMQQKDYNAAIDFYTQALDILPLNPIYLSNRAAAYSGASKHELAKQDAEMAVAADPKYTKAWSRLGLAKFALGDAKGSMEAYKEGIDAEGNGGSDAMRKGYETAKRRVEEEGGDMDTDDFGSGAEEPRDAGAPAGGMPDLAGPASMLGGRGGGGGGGGGMPDLSGIMNNPMLRQMAQNVMGNPDMMNNIMNNPRLREMADRFGGGGGMPDIASMMQDPNLAEIFMGGGAGRGTGP